MLPGNSAVDLASSAVGLHETKPKKQAKPKKLKKLKLKKSQKRDLLELAGRSLLNGKCSAIQVKRQKPTGRYRMEFRLLLTSEDIATYSLPPKLEGRSISLSLKSKMKVTSL